MGAKLSTLRNGVQAEIKDPSGEQIRLALEGLREIAFPLLSVEVAGGFLEAVPGLRAGFILDYRSPTGEAFRSASDALELEVTSLALERFAAGDDDWRESTNWRPYAWPEEDSPEARRLSAWLKSTSLEVSRRASRLSRASREWILRRMIHDVVFPKRSTAASRSNALDQSARHDLELYLFRVSQDILRSPDA